MFADVTAGHIEAAARRLAGVALRTRLIRSAPLSALAGGDVWLKLECEQRTGSFKLRGAYNSLVTLSPAQRAAGVVASSAGNHGLGCAWAARELGIAATIYVPATAPVVKKEGIRALGATVDDRAPHYDAAHELAVAHAARTGATFVSPQDGDGVFAGQGTVAIEILEELPALAAVVVSVGGGGLLGGIGRYLKSRAPQVRVIGAQGDRSNAMSASVAAGRVVEVPVPATLADGLSGQVFEEGLRVGLSVMDEIAVASEEEIGAAIAWLYRTHGVIAEGAGAAGVAALRGRRIAVLPTPAAVVVTGSNINPEVHARVLREFPA